MARANGTLNFHLPSLSPSPTPAVDRRVPGAHGGVVEGLCSAVYGPFPSLSLSLCLSVSLALSVLYDLIFVAHARWVMYSVHSAVVSACVVRPRVSELEPGDPLLPGDPLVLSVGPLYCKVRANAWQLLRAQRRDACQL